MNWRRMATSRPAAGKPGAGSGSPSVSAVVPLYNHATYIAEAIASLLAQGPLLKEVVVIDDGSSDRSTAIMRKLAAGDSRISFHVQANRGAHATLNTALGMCNGEFLAILNSDDAWEANRLATLVNALDADTEAGVAWSLVRCVDGAGADVRNVWYDSALEVYRAGGDLGAALLNGNFMMTTSNLLFRRAVWQAVGPFAALRYTHDLDWMLRALALGERVTIAEATLLRYRIHARNTIAEDHAGVRAEWAATASAYLSLLWDRPGAPPIDWIHAASVQAVLRTHLLDRAVGPCMAYLRRDGVASLDRSTLLGDEAFRKHLAKWV